MSAAAMWFIVAALGQAASLQMIDAGPLLGYQHYAPFTSLLATHPWSLAIVAAQSLLVAVAVTRRVRVTAPTGGAGFSWRRIALAVLLTGLVAATVQRDVTRFAEELIFAAYLQVLSLATLVLMAMAIPARALPGWARVSDRWFGSHRLPWVFGTVAMVLAATLSLAAYERHPHVPDEVVYLFNAKYFSEGQLTLPAPPVPAAFDVDLMEYEPTRWYSPMAAGWPAVLALGTLAGVPWLVNPLLAAVNVVLTFGLLTHLFSRRIAGVAAALLAVSPWFVFLGMSFMTHQLTLTCVLGAALGIVHARRTGRPSWGLLAGAAIGAVSLIRPLDGVIVGLLLLLWALGVGGTRLRLAPLAGVLAGAAVVGALVLPYNQLLTGDPLKVPINSYFDKHYAPNANAYGFGPDRGMGWAIDPNPGHSPIDGAINTHLNTFSINTELFGWSTGSLLVVAWLLCSGRLHREDRQMLAVVGAFVTAYFFYYFSGGPDFGARYWFPVVVPLVALTARGLHEMEQSYGARVWITVAAMSLMTVTTFMPWRAVDKYHNYRGMRAEIRELAQQHGFGTDLVLVRGSRFPDYASAFAQNPADLRSPATIYAWDRDAETRQQVIRAYQDRRIWLVDGPSITGSGYRIADGPLAASTLLVPRQQN